MQSFAEPARPIVASMTAAAASAPGRAVSFQGAPGANSHVAAVEAFPDIADVTTQVITMYPGHAAEEVEQQITIPLERELSGLPGLHVMRSKSTFGLSLICIVFRDGVESYWARQRI